MKATDIPEKRGTTKMGATGSRGRYDGYYGGRCGE